MQGVSAYTKPGLEMSQPVVDEVTRMDPLFTPTQEEEDVLGALESYTLKTVLFTADPFPEPSPIYPGEVRIPSCGNLFVVQACLLAYSMPVKLIYDISLQTGCEALEQSCSIPGKYGLRLSGTRDTGQTHCVTGERAMTMYNTPTQQSRIKQ